MRNEADCLPADTDSNYDPIVVPSPPHASEPSDLLRFDANLQESEERFRATFEQAAVGIAHLSPEGRFLRLNRKFCDIIGYSPQEAYALTLNDITHPDDLETDLGYIRLMLAGEIQTYSMEKRYLRRDGGEVWVNLTKSLTRLPSGAPKYFIGVIEDITARKQVEAERERLLHELRMNEERLSLALGAGHSGAWDWDLLTGKAWWSPEMYPLWGVPPGTAMETDNSLAIIDERDRQMVQDKIAAAIEQHTDLQYEFRIRHAALGERAMASLGRIIYDEQNRAVRINGISQDITVRKQREEALRAAVHDLRAKTEEQTRANAELQRFTYVASHDLQEPLRMISSYVQLLERRYGDNLDAEAREFIGYAVDGAERLQGMIRDLLQYSRVETRGQPFEQVDCAAIIEIVRQNLRLLLEESQAVVTRGKLPVLLADKDQLISLFQNLLSNAVKFRGKKPPRIQIQAKEEGDNWLFFVRDNGMGLDPQHSERIFIIFQRLHGREYPGTGIGLSICKRIVERHGGRIWVESQPGRGATFYFILPKKGEQNVHVNPFSTG